MENEVDLAPAGPDLSSTPNLGPGSSPLYPGQGAGLFGSNRLMIKPTAEVNPLDNAERLLTAERDKLQGAASRPIVQFLWHDEAKMMADEAAQKSLQIQQIQEKRQQQQTNQALARNMGLTRGMSPTAGPGDITEEALREWRENGNYDAYRGLHGAGQGARADLYMDEGVNALGKQTEAAQKAVGQLNSATNQAEYNSIRSQVLKHPEFSSLGMNETNLPKYQTEWKEKRGGVTAKLNQAQQVVETFNQKQASLSQAVPITDEKVAKAVTAPLRMSSGESFPNTDAVTLPGAGGAQGALAQPGSKDIAHYGPDGWNNATPENVKTVREQFASEEVKGAISKYKMSKDFAATANNNTMYRSAAGLALIADELGAIGRDVAEGSKAAGSIGLTRMLNEKYGSVENFLNSTTNNYAAWKAWATSGRKGVEPKLEPRMTDQSIQGIKDVANFKAAQTKAELERAGGPVETAGRYGIALEKTGLDKGAQDIVRSGWQDALDKAKLDYDRYPAIIKGDRRVILPQDAQVPGMIPAGSYAKGLPKAGERGTGEIPAKGATAAPAATGLSSPGGGGGAPAIPPAIAQNPVATTVYGAAGQTGMAGSGGNPTVARNAAIIATSSAKSESAFNPDQTHDGGIGYGLFGHNQDRLESMRKFAGTKPGEPIAPDVQAAFFVKELGQAAERDPFIRKVMNDPNASAADLTRVQMHMERPKGYTPGSPESGHNWQGRLANTQELMQPGKAQPTAEQIAAYNANKESFATMRAKMAASATHNAANIAPALGATAGMLGGPVGSLVGGAAGGAVRQGFNGGPGYVDQMARGALEAVPAAIPGVRPLATAARVVAGGAVPAAEKLYDSGGEDTSGAIESGAAGAVGGILGEVGLRALGRGFGMVGDKIFSGYTTPVQKEIAAAAKTLATQEPKVADATGKMVPNKAYEQAEQVIKDRLPKTDVEHVVYAYNTSKQGVASANANPKDAIPGAALPTGAALVQRPGMTEAARIGREEYQPIREEVAAAGKNMAPKAQGALPDGPISTIRTTENPGGTIPDTPFWRKQAEHYEMNASAPARSVDEKWQRLGADRTELLGKERSAIGSDHPNKDEFEKGFRAMADSLRTQQEGMAKALLPPDKATALIQRLETADKRYRNALTAGGPDIVKTIAKGGAEGVKAKAAFYALVGNDPAAKRIVNALVAVEQGQGKRAGVAAAIGAMAYPLHLIPGVGTLAAIAAGGVSAVQGKKLIDELILKKGAGAPVKFETMLKREIASKGHMARAGSVIGSSIGNQMAQ